MDAWQKRELACRIPELIAKWEPIIGVEVREWVIQKMERKWGTCNKSAGRIRLNSRLACLPISNIEYVVVHEMVHLHERNHGPRFQSLMDGFLPQWRTLKSQLSEVPLG